LLATSRPPSTAPGADRRPRGPRFQAAPPDRRRPPRPPRATGAREAQKPGRAVSHRPHGPLPARRHVDCFRFGSATRAFKGRDGNRRTQAGPRGGLVGRVRRWAERRGKRPPTSWERTRSFAGRCRPSTAQGLQAGPSGRPGRYAWIVGARESGQKTTVEVWPKPASRGTNRVAPPYLPFEFPACPPGPSSEAPPNRLVHPPRRQPPPHHDFTPSKLKNPQGQPTRRLVELTAAASEGLPAPRRPPRTSPPSGSRPKVFFSSVCARAVRATVKSAHPVRNYASNAQRACGDGTTFGRPQAVSLGQPPRPVGRESASPLQRARSAPSPTPRLWVRIGQPNLYAVRLGRAKVRASRGTVDGYFVQRRAGSIPRFSTGTSGTSCSTGKGSQPGRGRRLPRGGLAAVRLRITTKNQIPRPAGS